MKNLLSLSLLCTLISCGNGYFRLDLPDENSEPIEKEGFFMSTSEELIEKYGYYKKVDLREVIPELDSLPITYDSFHEVYEALAIEATDIPSNFSVLKKDTTCTAQIGYCEAYIIKRIKRWYH